MTGGGLILAVESSCDETGIAIVEDGVRIHANVVASQVAMHAASGGIVPEVAARAHLRWIVPVLDEAWAAAGVTWDEIAAVAVTNGPGLAGSLIVGINFAKTLAYVHGKPLVPVNHLEGHLYAAWLADQEREIPEPLFPLVALIVSGGHTFLVEMRDHLQYRLLGETVDDAAGEAFDKVGRLLGLPYPGGPAIMKAAAGATRHDVTFPRAWLADSFDFSFSGLKTAARRVIATETDGQGTTIGEAVLPEDRVAELAYGFQDSVVDVLVTKTLRAARAAGAKSVVLGGGVAANRVLRDRLAQATRESGIPLVVPRPSLCTDNGAMIAAAGARRFAGGARAGLDLDWLTAGPAAPAGKPPRLDALAVRRQLREEGLHARHSMSQNFLADPDVLQSILDLAAPEPGRRILEVGPGLGILTGGLIAAGASVVAVELDRRLAERLARVQSEAVASAQLRVVQGDILDQKIAELMAAPYDVVANVPYHITSPILHRFLGEPPRPERLVLMLQREVAERIAAAPGAMSYLSVFVQYHAAVRIAFAVPRDAFEPAPEVESAVVEITPLDPAGERTRLDPAEEEHLWRVVQAGFRERRKKLHNVMSRQLKLPGPVVAAALAKAGIDGDRRPQTLSVDEWLALRVAIGPLPDGLGR